MTTLTRHTSMTTFSNYRATKTLKKLAEHPFDLTKLTPERLSKYSASSCGYKLVYGTERISDDVMEALHSLAKEAQTHEKMHQMQSGAHVNLIQGYPSEDRPALHTATRDFFDSPNKAKTAREAAHLALQEINKLKSFIKQLDKENRFKDIILIGIGGSDLGPRAHFLALQYLLKPGRSAQFISNIDPDDAALALSKVDLAHTLVLVISKTGTTLETKTNEELVRKRLEQAGLNSNEQMVSVTMPGSPLDDKTKYRECFYIWDWIGGRYSTTSMVGGVLLAFAFGFDVFWELLRGANAMDKAVLEDKPQSNLPLLSALLGIWNRNFLNHPTLAIIPYSQALVRFAAHIQQLDMESHGKRIDTHGSPVDFETGPIIWGETGTSSQHSFFQLLHQGTTVVPLELIGFQECQFKNDLKIDGTTSQQKLLSNLFGQMLALALGQNSDNPNKVFPGNRPTHLLFGKQLTPYALGTLLSFYEHKIAFQGFIWDINSFDQEGVQYGKVLANKIIKRFADPKSPPYPMADTLINMLTK